MVKQMRSTRRTRRGRQRPLGGLTGQISRYLLTDTTTRHAPMRSQGPSITVPIVSSVLFKYGIGLGPNGLTIPEHPGRAITQFGSASTIYANTSWSRYAALYDEFRVVAIVVEFQPTVPIFNNASIPFYSIVGLCDYDSEVTAGSLTTQISALNYSTSRLLTVNHEHQLLYQPTGQRSFPLWDTTASTTARGCVYYFANSDTGASFNMGMFVIKHIVKFRNANG